MKALKDADLIICGYYLNTGNTASAILGAYNCGIIQYQGHVALGVSRQDFELMGSSQKAEKGDYPDFPDFEEAVWLTPRLVCRIEFMERTPGGGLRQPVFKGIRDDKIPDECTV